MQRPLLLEGEPGTGKTALAEAIAESLGPAADPAAVLRGHRRRRRRSTTGTSRGRSCTCARSRRPAAGGRRRGGREEPVRRALPARPAGAGRAPAEPGGAAGRRGRPGRRRVRGVPARGAVDLPGHASPSSARSTPRRRRSSCSPPTAPASCTTRSSGAASTTGSTTPASSARSRSSARGRPRCRRRWPRQVVALVQRLRDARRPAQAARRRRDPRLGAGAGPPRHRRARPGTAAATLGALVKYREDADRVQQALDRMLRSMSDSPTDPRRPTRSCSASPARCGRGRAGHPGPGAGLPRGRVRCVGLDDQRATYWAGRATLCAGPDDLARYDQVFDGLLQRPRRAAPAAAGHAPARRDLRCRSPRTTTAARATGRRRAVVRALASDDRGAAAPRHRAMTAAREAAAGRDVRDPAPAPSDASYGAAPALAPRRRRRLPHAARQPAPDGRARRDRLAAPRHAAAPGGAAGRRVRLDERRTPTRCCGWRTGSRSRGATQRRRASRRSRSAPG